MRLFDDGTHIKSVDHRYHLKIAPVKETVFFLLQGTNENDLEIIAYIHGSEWQAGLIYNFVRAMIPEYSSVTKRKVFASIRQICNIAKSMEAEKKELSDSAVI